MLIHNLQQHRSIPFFAFCLGDPRQRLLTCAALNGQNGDRGESIRPEKLLRSFPRP